ncbi:hypothetical protein IJU97_00880 [bacterium]|nr:hypothetical protein [bacterium]
MPQIDAFYNADLWLGAMGQSFFSLSIMSGVMIVYGSFLRKNSNIFVD